MGDESQAIPAIASFFIPGLGQLAQGRLISSLVWFTIAFLSALLIFAVIGVVLYPIVCFVSAYDAAKWRPRKS